MTTTGLILNMIHPAFIMIIMGVVVLCLPKKAAGWCYVLAPIAALASIFTLNSKSTFVYKVASGLKLNLVHFDSLAFVFLLAFCIIAVIATIYSAKAETNAEKAAGLIYAGCNMGVILAADCLSLIVFWELAAISSAYLVYCKRDRESERAMFRYILVHAFGGAMLLAGLLSYMFNYGNSLENITSIAGTGTFWVIFIGVAVNAAVPPISSWLPDAYPESTFGGTVFLGSYTTKAAIYLMIRLFAGTEWLVWVGAFMAVYGILMALLENDLRRLLSYHIISQLGYMVAALAMGGVLGVGGAAAHAFANIMYKGVLLMVAGAVIFATGKRKISELSGLGKQMPLEAICFLIASLAISGVPFLNGFASKALVMTAVEEGGYTVAFWMLTAASIGTWLSVTLKINWFAFWKPTDEPTEVKPVPLNMKVGIVLGTVICIITGLVPKVLYVLLPGRVELNPFTLARIFEYIVLFIGATIVFYILRKKMAPHDELSLDFDWFYRIVLNKFILAISKALYAIFDWCGNASVNGVRKVSALMSDPYLITEKSHFENITEMSLNNKDKRVGDIVLASLVGVAVMIIVVALI